MTAQPEHPALRVERTIPVPVSISEEAQRALVGGGPLNLERAPTPPLDDIEGWRAYLAEREAMLCMMMEARTADVRAKVETITVGDIPVYVITPEDVADSDDEPVYYDIHGGALTQGKGATCIAMGKARAAAVNRRTWAIDYRMPPDHPFPAALDDCLAVYRRLLEVQAPEQIVVGGGSAGGNLAAALMLRVRDEGLPYPAGLALVSPELDLTESGDSFETNLGVDTVLGRLTEMNALYAGGHDLADPYVSPLFGDYAPPFPRTFLQAGTRDLFLSNTVRMHRKLRAAGIEADLHIWEAMPHGGFFGAPEDREVAAELKRFIDDCLESH
jgi:monoterpene epsilon-lactone hydrolase